MRALGINFIFSKLVKNSSETRSEHLNFQNFLDKVLNFCKKYFVIVKNSKFLKKYYVLTITSNPLETLSGYLTL